MSIELNHTIVHVSDRDDAARELAAILGVAAPTSYGPFAVVALDNGVSLDFVEDAAPVRPQHSPSSSTRSPSTRSTSASAIAVCRGGPTRSTGSRGRSTPTTAAAVSTGRALTATTWRSSRGRTGAERGAGRAANSQLR